MLPFIEEDLVLIVSSENQSYVKIVHDKIEELGLKNRVHFCNNVTEEEKWALIQNCESMCHPSTAEGFGIPPIEAMAFGKPVFLSNLTSLPEIGGEVAFYFENFETDYMVEVYKKGMNLFADNIEEISRQLIKRSKEFDYKVMAEAYLGVYNKL